MAYRNIIIESPAHVSIDKNRLAIRTDQVHHIPLEDISALLLESRQSTITTAALSQLGQCGCAVYFCDGKHLPCAVLTPYQQHSRSLTVLRGQLDATEPRKKQLWQSIVRAKLNNQAKCLQLAQLEDPAQTLLSLSHRVRSGDPDNLEATGAQLYFPSLFGSSFTRNQECGINSALNYGYAVLRGAMVRYLCVYGFLPAFGLHHRSTLNPFNLADDLMEPFRPVVDRLVCLSIPEQEQLTPHTKRQLFNCLNLDILSGGQRHSVSYAMERLVQSLGKALHSKEQTLLLPELLELQQHRYE